MSSLSVNPLMPNLAAKPNLIDRTHYSGPSSGTVHHSHHSHSSKGSGKHSIALTALTLLSFLFFLNILQNCLQEHMEEMNNTNTQQVIIVQARTPEIREVAAQKRKGETELFNSSITKETRNNPESVKTVKPKPLEHYAQIPVKLRTYEKAGKP